MSASILLAAALLLGLLHKPYQPTITHVYGQGGWRLTVQTDAFTRQTTCRLENRDGHHPDITIGRDALAFHFNRRLDTYSAWYQVDDSAPRPWRDMVAHLREAGSILSAESLDNSTDGIVLIPFVELGRARRITVRPSAQMRPSSFDLGVVPDLIASARRLGCQFEQL